MIEARLQQEIILRSDDQVSVLADITSALSEIGINLLSVRLLATAEGAIVHLLTTSQSYACEALRDAGFDVSERDVVMLELPPEPNSQRVHFGLGLL